MFLGFAGEGFGRDEQALLKPGQTVHGRSLRAAARRHSRHRGQPEADGHRRTSRCSTPTARELGTMYPAKWFYRSRPQEPTTEVAIRRSLAEDLYIVMAGFELGEQSASVEMHVNELVNWIWIGFGLMALGTGIALLPERVFAFAGARVGAEATAATLLLMPCCWRPAGARRRSRSEARPGTLVFRSAAGARPGQRGHVHLRLPAAGRHVRDDELRGQGVAAGEDARRWSSEGKDRDAGACDASCRTSAASTSWRGRSTRAITGLLWILPVHAGGRDGRRRWRCSPAAGRRRPPPTRRRWARRRPMRTPDCSNNSTMSSATSTDPGLRPWQLFLLAGMLAATAVVLVSTGQSMSSVVVLSLTVVAVEPGGGGRVPVARRRCVVDRGRRSPDAPVGGPHPRGARTREGAGAAHDQGTRVRPRDAQDRDRRLRGDARSPASCGRCGLMQPARRQRLPRRGRADLARARRRARPVTRAVPAPRRCRPRAAPTPARRASCAACGTTNDARRPLLQAVRRGDWRRPDMRPGA